MMHAGRALAWTLLACSSTGCRGERSAPTDAGGAKSSGAVASDARPDLLVVSSRPAPDFPRPLQGGCRILAVTGDVRAAGTSLVVDGEVPQDKNTWMTLGPASKLAVKDARTTREATFLGPAQARACVERREESWLASGSFESEVGAGEAPGAEEWVVTPTSVVRYAAAKLRIDVHPKDAAVAVAAGVAFVWPAGGCRVVVLAKPDASGGGGDDGEWKRVGAQTQASVGPASRRPADPLGAARDALDVCEPLARRARDLATTLLSGAGDAGGEVAAKQFETRRLARAACAVAALRLDTAESEGPADPADRQLLRGRLADAVAAWSSLPVAPRDRR